MTDTATKEMRLTIDGKPLLTRQTIGTDSNVLCIQMRQHFEAGEWTSWAFEPISTPAAASDLLKQFNTSDAPTSAETVQPVVAVPAPPAPVAKPIDIKALKQIGIKAQQERLSLMMPMAQLDALRAQAAAKTAPPPQKSHWADTIAKHTPATKQGEHR